MPEPETHYTRSKDGHVAYQVVGDGPFDVVLIPAPSPAGPRGGDEVGPMCARAHRTLKTTTY